MNGLVRTRLASVAAASLLLAASCSDSDGGSGAVPIPEERLLDEYISALCGGLASCCASSGYAADEAACRTNLRTQMETEAELPSSEDGVRYDAQAAGECVSAMRQTIASCYELEGDRVEVCERVFVGTKPAGSPCTSSLECAEPPGAWADCDWELNVCVVELRGQLGDACAGTCTEEGSGYSCMGSGSAGGPGDPPPQPPPNYTVYNCWTNDGLYCSSEGVCQPLIAVGSACDLSEACVQGAYCDYASSQCVPVSTVGGPCDYSEHCVDGAYCTAAGICEAQKPAGAPCTDWDECVDYCDELEGVCVGTDGDGDRLTVTPEICAGQVQ